MATISPAVEATLDVILAHLRRWPNGAGSITHREMRIIAGCRSETVTQAFQVGLLRGAFSVTQVGRHRVYTLARLEASAVGNMAETQRETQAICFPPDSIRAEGLVGKQMGSPLGNMGNMGNTTGNTNSKPSGEETTWGMSPEMSPTRDATPMRDGDGDAESPDNPRTRGRTELYLLQQVTSLPATPSPSEETAEAPQTPTLTREGPPPPVNGERLTLNPRARARADFAMRLATQANATLYGRWCLLVEQVDPSERLDLLLELAHLCIGMEVTSRNRAALEKMVREPLTDGQPRGILAVARYLTLLAHEETIRAPLRLLHEVARRRENGDADHQRRYDAESPAARSAAAWERARAASPLAEDWIDTSKLVRRIPF